MITVRLRRHLPPRPSLPTDLTALHERAVADGVAMPRVVKMENQS